MTPSQIISFVPASLLTIWLMRSVMVVYALHRKGDVTVRISRGKTLFELEAKEREADKSKSERTVGVPLAAVAPTAPLHDVSFHDPG